MSASTAVGAPTTSFSAIFHATDEQMMNATIEVLDASENVLFSKLVENVPFQRNRRTKLSGSLYSAPAAGSFLPSTGWLNEESVSF